MKRRRGSADGQLKVEADCFLEPNTLLSAWLTAKSYSRRIRCYGHEQFEPKCFIKYVCIRSYSFYFIKRQDSVCCMLHTCDAVIVKV